LCLNTQRVGSLQAKRPFGPSAAVYSVDNINNGLPYWVIQRTWGHSIFEVELCQNPPPFCQNPPPFCQNPAGFEKKEPPFEDS